MRSRLVVCDEKDTKIQFRTETGSEHSLCPKPSEARIQKTQANEKEYNVTGQRRSRSDSLLRYSRSGETLENVFRI